MSRALHLLAETPEAETPAQHLRNAVQLLILADERLAALTIPPDAAPAELIRGAEARVFHALFTLDRRNP